jgi:hypothetical protein
MVLVKLLLFVLTTPTEGGVNPGSVTYACPDSVLATKFGAELGGRLIVVVPEMRMLLKVSFVIEAF